MTRHHPRDERHSRWPSVRVVLTASLVFAGGCMDATPSAPARDPLGPESARRSADANQTSPAFATASVSIGQDVLIGFFPQKTRVVATLSGTTSVSTQSGCEETHTYGAGGHPYGLGGTISIYSDLDGMSGGPESSLTSILDVQGEVKIGQLRPGILESDCGSPYIWTGSGTGSVQRLDATLGIGIKFNVPGIITEFSPGYPGRTLTWLPLTDPAGMRAAVDSSSWKFVPDDGSPATPACISKTASECVMRTTTSGTLSVSGYANAGEYTSASLHITVTPRPTVKLRVSKNSVRSGESILVTTTIANATSSEILRYEFSGSATGTCMNTARPAPATCDLVPTTSGSLNVVALLDDERYSDSQEITVVQGSKALSMECTPSAPVRGTDVHCHVRVSDGSAFMLTQLKATDPSDGTLIVAEAPNQTTTDYDWTGKVGAQLTNVDATAIVDGQLRTASGSFGVTARSFVDPDQPEPPPQLKGLGVPPMLSPYPGLVKTPNGAATTVGGLGRTLHLMPDYDYLPIDKGPNKNIVMIAHFKWVDPQPAGAAKPLPAGTYLSAALFPGDAFYNKQRGGGDFCGAAEMNALRNEIHAHEIYHYHAAIQLRRRLKLHEQYEAMYVIAPAGLNKAIEVALYEFAHTYQVGITNLDTAIDANPATAAKTSINCELRF